jgi:hypothetical protein
MKILNPFVLISFVIYVALFSAENSVFCKQIERQKQKASNKQPNNKEIFRSMRNNSTLISKNKNMNSNFYSILGRFGKKRSIS